MSESEFLIIITPFKDKMFRISRRLLVSTEEAEDAVQEVILKLWRNRNKFSDYKNLEAYSITITKNWCFDQLKSKITQRGPSAFLTIQEGCDKFCSFCVVPYTRGSCLLYTSDAADE